MTATAMDDEERSGFGQILRYAVPASIIIAIAAVVVYFLNDTAGTRREAPPIATMVAVLPPPPPPPPEKEKPPEPDKKVEPVEKLDQPKAVDSPPKQITINGPAQAGSDAFGLAAGSGGGVVAGTGGFGNENYGRYLGSAIQQIVQRDENVNRLVFSADIAIWVDESGRITRVKIIRSSGDATTDDALVAALQGGSALQQPPPGDFQFPQRISVSGRRPG